MNTTKPKSQTKQILAYLLAIVLVFPVGYLLLLSLSKGWVFPHVPPPELSFLHWSQLINGSSGLLTSLVLSLVISFSVATLATLGGFITSRHIAYHPRRRLWMLLSYFPFLLSPVIYAALIYFYFVRYNASGHLGGVILAQLLITYPYAIILFSGFWNKRLEHMQQLVTTLGGNTRHIYRRVLIPMARGLLLVCFFQTFLISWFEYGLTTIIGVGKVQTLTLKVFQYINEANFYQAALSSFLLILPPLLLLYFNKRYIYRKHL